MIHIQFQEPATRLWLKWLADADREAAALCTRWQEWRAKVEAEPDPAPLLAKGFEFEIDRALYTRRKDDFVTGYLDKCVYCEGQFKLVAYGDLDHYRPKQAVLQAKGQTVNVTIRGTQIAHPGYFWLAYDYRNLLPTCSQCNSAGKGALFPVQGDHAGAPGQEGNEKPLIFHPCYDEDPEPHFTFDPETGFLGWRTERAQACIEVFKLNLREELVKARRKAYCDVVKSVNMLLTGFRTLADPVYQEALGVLEEHRAGKAAYALAGRQALRDLREPIRKLFAALQPLFGI